MSPKVTLLSAAALVVTCNPVSAHDIIRAWWTSGARLAVTRRIANPPVSG
jgi:hypothetical protein